MPTNPVSVWKAPQVAPGRRVAQSLQNGDYMVRSATIAYNASSPVNLFVLPAYTLVVQVLAQVTTAFDGALASVAVGVSGTTGRHLQTTDVDVKTVGWYGPLVPKPYEYTASTILICTVVQGGSTQGAVVFWIETRCYTDKWARGPQV